MNRGVLETAAVVAFVLFLCIGWWTAAKATHYRKHILATGMSFLVAVIGLTAGPSLHSGPISLIGFAGLVACWYFLIKAWIAERKFKRESRGR